MSWRIFVILCILVLPGVGVLADQVLLHVTPATDLSTITREGDATLQIIGEGTLRVTTGHLTPWPGIALTPPAGKWISPRLPRSPWT